MVEREKVLEDRAVADSVAIQRLERRVKSAEGVARDLEASCRESQRLSRERDCQASQTSTRREEQAVSPLSALHILAPFLNMIFAERHCDSTFACQLLHSQTESLSHKEGCMSIP